MTIGNFGIALPEITVAIACVVALLTGALMHGRFSEGRGVAVVRGIIQTSIIAVIIILAVIMPDNQRQVGFSGFYVYDEFSRWIKILLLSFTWLCLYIGKDYFKIINCKRFEIPVLYLMGALGGMVMISANDFLPMYMGLELQTLSLYTLVAVHRDSTAPTEAGLKYFVLGALASGFLLYGISLLYGFSGSTQFENLAQTFSAADMNAAAELNGTHIGVITALVFIFAGAAFKMSAAPFHMWTPDVYQGAPTPVSAYLSTVSKIAAFAMVVRLLVNPLNGLSHDWNQIIIMLAVISAAVGAFAGLVQIEIKRLLGYSTIANIGFIMMALAGGMNETAIKSAIFYTVIYAVTALGLFAVILCMKQKDKYITEISDLQGIASCHPGLALCTAVLLFSAAGLPPMAGFLSKLFVFQAVVQQGYYALAVIGVLLSVVSAFYYLRIIRVMYMDESLIPFDKPLSRRPYIVAIAAAFTVSFFIFIPEPVLHLISDVAQMLIQG